MIDTSSEVMGGLVVRLHRLPGRCAIPCATSVLWQPEKLELAACVVPRHMVTGVASERGGLRARAAWGDSHLARALSSRERHNDGTACRYVQAESWVSVALRMFSPRRLRLRPVFRT